MQLTTENIDITNVSFEPADQLTIDTRAYEVKLVKVFNREQFDVLIDVSSPSARVSVTPDAHIVPMGASCEFTVRTMQILDRGRHHVEVMLQFKIQKVHESPYEPVKVAFLGSLRDQLTFGTPHYKLLPLMFLGFDSPFWYNTFDEFGNMVEMLTFGVQQEEDNVEGEGAYRDGDEIEGSPEENENY